MGLLTSWLSNEPENVELRTTGNSLETLFDVERNLTEEDIVRIPTVQKCLDIITGTVAQLPIYLYRENPDGSIERVPDEREFLLNSEPNEFENSYNFKKNLVKNYLLHGVNYTIVERKDNQVVELHNLNNNDVTVEKFTKTGYKPSSANVIVSPDEGKVIKLKPYDLCITLKESNDGLTSKGVLSQGAEVFKLIYGEMEYSKNIFNNGALPTGILETDGRLTQPVVDRLRDSWKNLYSGMKNAGKTVILEEGLSYRPVSLNPNDLQLSANRRENISEVCKLFNMPESLVIPSANKYGSLQQDNIHFLQYCLNPILTAIESALNKGLLLEDEKKEDYFWQVDSTEIIRTTEKDKFETVKVALESGVMSINEARRMLNLKDIKDDIMKWSLGNVLYYPESGKMTIPNMGIGASEEMKQDGKDSTKPEQDV